MGRLRAATIRLLAATVIAPLLLLGQGGIAVTGTIADSSGAAIAGAKITLVLQETNQKQVTTSDKTGSFGFKDVPPGKYSLRAEASGFAPHQEILTVGLQEPGLLKIKLNIASLEEELVVEADSADERLSPASNVSATKVSDDLLEGLPLPSESILTLIGKFVFPAAQGVEGISIVVDGVEGREIDVPSSTIRTVRINRDPFSAAFQHPGDGRAEITTKRGHKSYYHGNFALFTRNSVFNARNAFASSTPDLNWRLLEAGLGGPLPGRRASFYIVGEHLVDDQSEVVNAVTLQGPFVANVPAPMRRDRILIRLQWVPRAQDTINLRYTSSDQSRENDGVGGFNLPEQGVSMQKHRHELMLNYGATRSGTSRNDLTLRFKQEDEHIGGPAGNPAIVVKEAFVDGPSQSFTRNEQRTFDLLDSVTHIRGKHSLLFGGRYRTDLIDALDASNFGGTFEFSSLEEFAADTPFVFRVNRGDPNISFTEHRVSGFVQDEIRMRADLNLTFGLRYDWQSTIGDTNNFAPRLAFAFAPGKLRKTVLRGGVGIFYDNLPQGATQRSRLFDGYRFREVVISDPSYPNPFLSGRTTLPLPSVTRIAPDNRSPYMIRVRGAVERELWRRNSISVDYSYSAGEHLFRSRDINAPLPANGSRPEPDFLNIDQIESTAFLRSHALTVTWYGRIGKFFKPYAQYVLFKANNDTSGPFSLPANNYDLRPEVGPANFDQRHRLNVIGVLELPRGFRLGSVLSVGSSSPYDITTGFDNNGDTVANDRPAGGTRNTGRGPGTVQLDVRLTKTFNVPRLWGREQNQKGHRLEFNVDAFNVTNHTNVNNVVGVLSSPFFGRANSAADARTFQFSVGYRFPR